MNKEIRIFFLIIILVLLILIIRKDKEYFQTRRAKLKGDGDTLKFGQIFGFAAGVLSLFILVVCWAIYYDKKSSGNSNISKTIPPDRGPETETETETP